MYGSPLYLSLSRSKGNPTKDNAANQLRYQLLTGAVEFNGFGFEK